jgi:hypothetical protein
LEAHNTIQNQDFHVIFEARGGPYKGQFNKEELEGIETVCVCSQEENIQYLFFECHFARFIWTVIHIAFNI